MSMSEYSLSDLASATNGGGFGGGNSAWVIIILFALIFGWGGNGFGRGVDTAGQFATAASQSEILFGQQFQGLDNKIDRIGNGIADATFAINNSIKDGNAAVTNAVITEGRNMQTQLAQIGCENLRATDGIRYDMANFAAQINANTSAQTQKILDTISTNKMAEMQNQINQLQLQNAMCGVVRYPNASTYYAGTNPFCNCNCGNGNF